MKTERGLTLLELIVALAVFALLSAAAYSGLDRMLSSGRQVEITADRLAALQMTFHWLQTDLLQAVPRTARRSSQQGDVQPALYFASLDNTLSLTRTGQANPMGLRRSQLQRVRYRLEADRLIRDTWDLPDQPANTEPRSSSLLAGIGRIQYRFFDGANWMDRWPVDSANPTALPPGVEVTLEFPGDETYTRLFLLPANSTDSNP